MREPDSGRYAARQQDSGRHDVRQQDSGRHDVRQQDSGRHDVRQQDSGRHDVRRRDSGRHGAGWYEAARRAAEGDSGRFAVGPSAPRTGATRADRPEAQRPGGAEPARPGYLADPLEQDSGRHGGASSPQAGAGRAAAPGPARPPRYAAEQDSGRHGVREPDSGRHSGRFAVPEQDLGRHSGRYAVPERESGRHSGRFAVPQQDPGRYPAPSTGRRADPEPDAGRHGTSHREAPETGGRRAEPETGGRRAAPETGGRRAAPETGGRRAVPETGGRRAAPEPQESGPPSGRRRADAVRADALPVAERPESGRRRRPEPREPERPALARPRPAAEVRPRAPRPEGLRVLPPHRDAPYQDVPPRDQPRPDPARPEPLRAGSRRPEPPPADRPRVEPLHREPERREPARPRPPWQDPDLRDPRLDEAPDRPWRADPLDRPVAVDGPLAGRRPDAAAPRVVPRLGPAPTRRSPSVDGPLGVPDPTAGRTPSGDDRRPPRTAVRPGPRRVPEPDDRRSVPVGDPAPPLRARDGGQDVPPPGRSERPGAGAAALVNGGTGAPRSRRHAADDPQDAPARREPAAPERTAVVRAVPAGGAPTAVGPRWPDEDDEPAGPATRVAARTTRRERRSLLTPSPDEQPDTAVRTVDLVKVHGRGARAVRALDGVTATVERGRFTAIMGPSGSGKSTLMHCLAGLDSPTSGRVLLGRTDLTRLSERKLTQLRRDRVGVVFQSYNLLPQLTVRQNIVLPLEVAGRRADRQWLSTVLDVLDLGEVLRQRPAQLSGGQQQRVAVARALLPRPDVVFADEPTGALDAGTAREMLQFLRASVDELGQTVVMVTHDPLAAQHTDRVLLLHEGRLAGELQHPSAHDVLDAIAGLEVGSRRSGGGSADVDPLDDEDPLDDDALDGEPAADGRAGYGASWRSAPGRRAARHA